MTTISAEDATALLTRLTTLETGLAAAQTMIEAQLAELRQTRLDSAALVTALRAEFEGVAAQMAQVRNKIVEQDERERSLRAILNYGHTIGHALEAVSRY